MGSLTPHILPIVDLTEEKLKLGSASWRLTCSEITHALEEYGCFVAVCDDRKFPSELHSAVFCALEELFSLPTGTKILNKSSKPLYGYVGQIHFIPLYESMGIDYANTLDGIQRFSKVMWANGNDSFCETMLPFTKMAAELEQVVVRMVFESYGLEKYYDQYIRSATYLTRIMRYMSPKAKESNLGFVSHTDKSFMTVLHQNQVNGLEVRARDGEWFVVDNLSPSSFVVMAGDAIMAWSNNRIQSPHHRVTMNGKETRYSLAQFTFLEGMVETPQELVDGDHPMQFKPFNHLNYVEFFSKEENRRLESALRAYCGI